MILALMLILIFSLSHTDAAHRAPKDGILNDIFRKATLRKLKRRVTPQGFSSRPSTMSQLALRGYQQEMLDDSLKRNIVIALDTGAGKTRIAILRMKIEVERQLTKVCPLKAVPD